MIFQVIVGFVMDLLLGDPQWFPHPVRGIGWLITTLEKGIRRLKLGSYGLKVAGVLLAAVVVLITYGTVGAILWAAGLLSPWAAWGVGMVFIYFELASRCLADEAMKIWKALKDRDIELARRRLSYIVGRDTQNLSEDEIIRGTVETVAENLGDGVVAPLFYIFLGGPALGMAYKAVNTLDSMVGYMNTQYQDLGWASARFDDIANWIPARIAGLLIPLAGGLWKGRVTDGFRILSRDRHNHKSPNGGYPEAAMAGTLGVQIGGTNYYFGKPVYKPTIGDPLRPLEEKDILNSVRIMLTTSVIALILFSAFYLCFI